MSGDTTSLVSNVTIEPETSASTSPSIIHWRLWLFGVGGATVASMGVVCNLVTIVVLYNFRSKSPAPFLLACLAVSDSIYLLSMLLLENLTHISQNGLLYYNEMDFPKHLYSYMYPLPHVTQTLSAYLVVVITLERYVVICWPFKVTTVCSKGSAVLSVLSVLVCSVLLHTPNYMAYTSGWAWDNDTQVTYYYFGRTNFGRSYFYTGVFFKWVLGVSNFAVPFLLLVFFNTLTLRTLRQSSLLGRSLSVTTRRRGESEGRLTVMIISMTAIFFLCELMAAIAHVIISGYNRYIHLSLAVNRFLAVTDFLMMVNAAVNFAIYCVAGRKFRETFKKMAASCCRSCQRRIGRYKRRRWGLGGAWTTRQDSTTVISRAGTMSSSHGTAWTDFHSPSTPEAGTTPNTDFPFLASSQNTDFHSPSTKEATPPNTDFPLLASSQNTDFQDLSSPSQITTT